MNRAFAWISFIGAVIAGAGLAVTGAQLVQIIAVLAALAIMALDIGKDRTPNQAAVLVAIILPSFLAGMSGGLARTLTRWLRSLWDNTSGHLGAWTGTTSMLGVAIACVAVSFIVARRTMPLMGGRGGASLMSRRGRG